MPKTPLFLLAAVLACKAQEFDAAAVKINRSGRMQSYSSRAGGRVVFENSPLREFIAFAYGIGEGQDYALSGPAWLDSERYDLEATTTPGLPRTQIMLMVRSLLADRFRLRLHRERKGLNVYTLVVARGGPKLKASSAVEDSFSWGSGRVACKALSMSEFASRLSGRVFKLDVPVLDETGVNGRFDFTLEWTPDDARPDTAAAASLFTAIQEQLGLRLTRAKRPVDIWVVDRAERIPVGN
jgi:uncharacterized protein (TIGR03435 family)